MLEANVDTAVEFARNCYNAYLNAVPKVRRQLNQAFFEKIYVYEDHVEAKVRSAFRFVVEGATGADDGEVFGETDAGQTITAQQRTTQDVVTTSWA